MTRATREHFIVACEPEASSLLIEGRPRRPSRPGRLSAVIVAQAVAVYVALVAAFWIGGELYLNSGLVDSDVRISERAVASRTETLDTLSWWGSMLAETGTKIAVTAIGAVLMYRVWRSWREPLVVVGSLALEAAVFLTVTLAVGRPRPPVPRLDDSPVNSSFPSGHTAAAAAYAAFAVVAVWRTRRRSVILLAVVASLALPAVVGWARFYRGMHHVSDNLAGVLLGYLCVGAVAMLLGRHGASSAGHVEGRE